MNPEQTIIERWVKRHKGTASIMSSRRRLLISAEDAVGSPSYHEAEQGADEDVFGAVRSIVRQIYVFKMSGRGLLFGMRTRSPIHHHLCGVENRWKASIIPSCHSGGLAEASQIIPSGAGGVQPARLLLQPEQETSSPFSGHMGYKGKGSIKVSLSLSPLNM